MPAASQTGSRAAVCQHSACHSSIDKQYLQGPMTRAAQVLRRLMLIRRCAKNHGLSYLAVWRTSGKQCIHDSLSPLQAIAEMAVLKLQSDKEQTMCEAEWKHLTQLLDADRQQRVSACFVTAARCHHCRRNPRAYYVTKLLGTDCMSQMSACLTTCV